MKSLFDQTSSGEILDRINKLDPKAAPQWGRMSVSKMLAHCRLALENSLTQGKVKRVFIGYIFGPIAKKKLLSDKEFDRNLPTNKNFIPVDEPSFEDEKQKLAAVIDRFSRTGGKGLAAAHPFFGSLTSEQWDLLTYKHLDHHLKQFGV